MVGDILTAVSLGLAEEFDCPIYADESISQGMERPCFFISMMEASVNPLPSGRSRMTVPLDIVFFSENIGAYSNMRKVGQELFDLLQVISLPDGSTVRGRGLKYEISDEALHFFITFVIHLKPSKEKSDISDIAMNNLDFQLGMD